MNSFLTVDSQFVMLFLSGLLLVVLGMRMMASGFQVLFAGFIRKLINSLSKNPLTCLGVGIANSVFIQSELSTSIMALSYSGSGLLNINQLILVLLGGGVGTAATVWLFGLPSEMDSVLIAMAGLPMMYLPWTRVAAGARVFFAIGLMLLGFNLMVARPTEQFVEMFSRSFIWFNGMSAPLQLFLLVIPAALLAMSIRSVVALVAGSMALVYADVISSTFAVLFVLAINFGKSLPVLMSSFESGTLPRRGALAHLLIQLIGLVVVAFNLDTLFALLNQIIPVAGASPEQTALYVPLTHTIFNILVVVVCSILFIPIKELVVKILPDKKMKEPQKLQFIGSISHMSPILAIEQVYQEVKKLAATAETTLELTVDYLQNQDAETYERILKYESITDNISTEIHKFLAKVMQTQLSDSQGDQVRSLLRMADELESITDKCKSIVSDQKDILGLGMTLEGPWYDELKKMMELLLSVYESAFWQLTDHSEESPQDFRDKVSKFDKKCAELKKSYMKFLQTESGSQYEWEAGIKYGDIVNSLMTIRKRTMNIFEAYSFHYKG